MTVYSPSVHRTVVAANGESSRKFHSVNKLLIDMAAAGMIGLHVGDDPPGDTTVVWLDLTLPENGNGQAKVYDSGSWVQLTPEYFALHYGASTAAAAASALAAANSASAAEGFKNQTISDASATAADVLTADAAKVAALAAQSAAEQARDEAEIAADNFDDVYLGSKATDPTLDNDGDALVEGQLYWSSATNALKVYDGASWISYSAASGITDLVDDTSPQLGGNLDLNGHVITGLEIGTNVQAQSSNLDSWSMVVPSDYLTTTAAAAAYQPISATLTSLAGASANGVSLVTAADYAAMRGLLDLEAGTDFLSPSAISAAYQAISARLTDIAGLAVTNGNIIVGDGAAWTVQSGAQVFSNIKQAATNAVTGVVKVSDAASTATGTATDEAVRVVDAAAVYSPITRVRRLISGTSDTLVLTDAGKLIYALNESATTITIPPNSSVAFAVDTQIDIIQDGAGQVSFVAGDGVIIQSDNSKKKISARYCSATLIKVATDSWTIVGSLSA